MTNLFGKTSSCYMVPVFSTVRRLDGCERKCAIVPQGPPMWTELHLKVVWKLLLHLLPARQEGDFLDMGASSH